MNDRIKVLIREIISKGEVEKAISIFKEWAKRTDNENLANELVHLSSRYSLYRLCCMNRN